MDAASARRFLIVRQPVQWFNTSNRVSPDQAPIHAFTVAPVEDLVEQFLQPRVLLPLGRGRREGATNSRRATNPASGLMRSGSASVDRN
jgi:hypothetical protein